MKSAFVYATYDGVINSYTGCALQTHYLLRALTDHRDLIEAETGEFDFFLAVPDPDQECLGYQVDPSHLQHSMELISSCAREFWALEHDEGRLWTIPKWQTLSASLANRIAGIADDYDRIAVVVVDAPFYFVPWALDESLGGRAGRAEVTVVHCLYSSTGVPGNTFMDGRSELEQRLFHRAAADPRVRLGDIGVYFTSHLVELGADADTFLPFRQYSNLDHPRFAPMERDDALGVVNSFSIPIDLPLVISFSRADPIKGIPRAIEALRALEDDFHFVLIAVPYTPEDPEIDEYRELLAASSFSSTFITEFQHELPRALCSLPETSAVVLASLGEPVGQVPQDVGMWAQSGGPVVVAAGEGGLVGQLVDGESAFYYEQGSIAALTEGIERAVRLGQSERLRMNRSAHRRVRENSDYVGSLVDLIVATWNSQAA